MEKQKSVMKDEGVINCCGARILARFGNCIDFMYNGPVSLKFNGIKGNKALQKELAHKVKLWQSQAFIIAILNSQQWNKIGHIFLEEGFEVVTAGWSGHKDSKLRLLVRIQDEESVVEDNLKKRSSSDAKKRAA